MKALMKTKIFNLTIGLSIVTLYSVSAWSLDRNGNGPLKNEAVVLYTFDETSGDTIFDKSTIGSPLNLTIKDAATSVIHNPTSLVIKEDTIIRSAGEATKLINQCKGTNEITIEAWIENQVQNDFVEDIGPLRIVTLSRNSEDSLFYLGQNYDGQHFYQTGLKIDDNTDLNDVGDDSTMRVAGTVLKHDDKDPPYQHVYFTRDKDGVGRIFVSDFNEIPILRQTTVDLTGNFNNWNSSAADPMVLALANDIQAFNDDNLPKVRGIFTKEDRPWRGTYHMMAIYCRALTTNEILGPRAPQNWLAKTNFPIDINDVITPNRTRAQLIYQRLVGVKTSIDNPVVKTMEAHLNAGNDVLAAQEATKAAGFYNRTVKDFAKRMSNRQETIDTPLDDFAATIIGHTRDNGDARELLYGDFYYRGSDATTAVPSDMISDFLMSNNHYLSLENLNYDLSDPSVLVRANGQKLYDGISEVVPHRDPAGLITSRGFLASHAIAGTNRRLVEFAFREFLCRPIKEWSDNTGPDAMVGRDVTRYPGADHVQYQSSCRGCHAMMDPLRQAFSRVTFENDFVKHTYVVAADAETDPSANNDNPATMIQVPALITAKMNRNFTEFPDGLPTTNDKWFNQATGPVNAAYFKWKPGAPMTGNGMKEFGKMLSDAGAFPYCMAKRAFRTVCKREAQSFDDEMLKRVANEFVAQDNYRLKGLFERVAITKECLGQGQ